MHCHDRHAYNNYLPPSLKTMNDLQKAIVQTKIVIFLLENMKICLKCIE